MHHNDDGDIDDIHNDGLEKNDKSLSGNGDAKQGYLQKLKNLNITTKEYVRN